MVRRIGFTIWLLAILIALPASALAIEIITGLPYGTRRIGHSAVRVRDYERNEDVIFDFGRYGETWGYLRFKGEGIMRVWRGEAAVARYIAEQRSFRTSIGVRIRLTEEEERRALVYYEKLLEGAQWSKEYEARHHTRYRLADDYYGVTNQCTSVALDGWRAAWPRERYEAIMDPRFNEGRGFNPAQHEYFFKGQRERSRNDVSTPLDVLEALRAARAAGHPDVGEEIVYPGPE